MLQVELPRPLPPGWRIVLEIGWSFPFGPNSNRMGMEQIDGSYVYGVAQWYPRLAVYDDVRGWNHEPYIGAGEFYLEYGSFDVSLTVPSNYTLGATGTLRNPEVVLTATQRSRLTIARSSAEPVAIITAREVGKSAQKSAGQVTWRFTADSVRDF